MLHRLRHAATTKSFNAPLPGPVEVMKRLLAEKSRTSTHPSGCTAGAAALEGRLGVLERDGELRAGVVENTKSVTLQGVVRANVALGAVVYTDDAKAYRSLQGAYSHHTVNHSAGEYVRDDAHTNSI